MQGSDRPRFGTTLVAAVLLASAGTAARPQSGETMRLIETTLAARSIDETILFLNAGEGENDSDARMCERVIEVHVGRALPPDLSLRDGQIGHAVVVSGLRICFPQIPDTVRRIKDLDAIRHCTIDLRGLHVGELADEGGLGWGEQSCIWLDGFRYARLPDTCPDAGALNKSEKGRLRWRRFLNPSTLPLIARQIPRSDKLRDPVQLKQRTERLRLLNHWERRLVWLNLQFFNRIKPARYEYSPDAYQELVNSLNRMGSFKEARKVASARLTLENSLKVGWLRSLRKLCWLIFRTCCDYGLSVPRTFNTFVVCLAIGAIGIRIADRPWRGNDALLVMKTSSPESRYSFEKSRAYLTEPDPKQHEHPAEVPCDGRIVPELYALDVFIPALNLHQQDTCSIRKNATAWRLVQAFYAILGWIVTPLTILTFTGILRRYVEK